MLVDSISLPFYVLSEDTEFDRVGIKVEHWLIKHFYGRSIALRGISLADHPLTSRSDMTERITTLGTDRYDERRRGVHFEFDDAYGIDIHATPMYISDQIHCPHYQKKPNPGPSIVGDIFRDFYFGAQLDRGYTLRIDMFLIYDLKQLQPVPMLWTHHGPKHYTGYIDPMSKLAFQFKSQTDKLAALLGVINLL